MDNRKVISVMLATAFICMCSCTDNNRSKMSTTKPIVSYENEVLNVTSLDGEEHSVVISIANKIVIQKKYKDICKLPVAHILKGYGSTYDVALMATSGIQPGIALDVKVDDVIDTILFATIEPLEIRENTSNISGNCAQLILADSDPEQEVNIKKWLFRKNTKLNQYQIQQMRGIISKISSKGTIDYITSSTIPVVRNFLGMSYSVKSDMRADHYVLFAASSEKEIKDFVEEVVSNNYELTSKKLSGGMKCFRKMESDGYKCITLVGINDDWSYQVLPLGLVAIDNTPPALSSNYSHNVNEILLKGNQRVVLPKSKPLIYGTANVSVLDWDGNGVECNVTFNVSFSGDAKSITVVRNKRLCYPGEHRIENKVINLTNKKSPYMFTYELHFEGGDNIIPIVVEDYHGNKNEYEINVPARFTRNNPDVQIDNNINVW